MEWNFFLGGHSNQQKKLRFNQFFVRRIFNASKQIFRSLNQTHSIRKQFEFEQYIRKHFVDHFDQHVFVFSVFLFILIDEFDLYRNMYRTIMNMYLNFAAFFYRKKIRRINVLSLTLKFHDNNFSNVVAVLQFFMFRFEQNEIVTLNDDQSVFICAFTLIYVSDMSQQQINSEFLKQRIKLSCRFCFINADERDNLNYNIVDKERFHHESMRMKKKMNLMNQIQQITYERQNEIVIEHFFLIIIFSALNLILSKLNDSAYSKYDDLFKLLHIFLLNSIFNASTQKQYVNMLRNFQYSSE